MNLLEAEYQLSPEFVEPSVIERSALSLVAA
jgi:hypothetical protein